MQTCKFCNKERALVKSHIIPRSFYEIETFKQKAPQKTLSMLSDSEDLKPERRPAGIYDVKLFCHECEKKFMIYDDYAFKLLNENINLRKIQRGADGQVVGEYYDSYDYAKLKLFFMSVLLKAGLSGDSFFQHVELGPYIGLLKENVDTGTALTPDEFAVFLAYYGEIKSGPVIFPPAPQRIENIKFYTFHLGRVIFYIKVDRRRTPPELMPIILKPGSKLFLIQYELQTSHAYEVMKKILKNPANLKYFST